MDFWEKECPVCSKVFHEGDDVVVCPKCGAPYHRECYKEKGKCIFVDLHQSKQSWQEVYDKTPPKTEKEEEMTACPTCGEKNPKNALICQKCGNFLSGSHVRFPFDENEKGEGFSPENLPEGWMFAGNPFALFIDPMGGVAKDEDFDGVSGSELARYVKTNTPYYMPVFKKIKDTRKGRFNFAAFFFFGGWYLYRKQYWKGAILSLFYFALVLVSYFVTNHYAADLWKEAYDAVTASGVSYPQWMEIFSWALAHRSSTELALMYLPYLLNLLQFVVQLFCGFLANRSYFRHSLKTIRKLKQVKNSENLMKEISENGGVNTPLAWSMMVCYLIILFSFSLF